MSPILQKYLSDFQRWRKRLPVKRSFQRLPDALTFDSASLTTLWLSTDQRTELRRETIQWSDVSSIWVYKRDCFTFDQISMAFHTNQRVVEFNEDMSGWQELMNQLYTLVPGTTPWEEWYLKIAFPAFEANITKIYDCTEKR